MRRDDFTSNEHDAKRRRLFVRGGTTDFHKSDGIHMLKYIIHIYIYIYIYVMLLPSPALQGLTRFSRVAIYHSATMVGL